MFASVKQLFVLILFLFAEVNVFSQTSSFADTATSSVNPYVQTVSDSLKKPNNRSSFQFSSWILQSPNAVKFDIEKPHIRQKNTWEFVWIIVFLITLTVLRTSFNRNLKALFTRFSDNSFSSINLNPGTFAETFLSVVLFIAFVINCSILSSVTMQYFYPKMAFNTTHLLLLFFFLFTFFFAVKTIVVRSLGFIFNERIASAMYLDNLFTTAKILAITTFPLVMFFSVAEKNVFSFLVTLYIIMVSMALLFLIWRWLSTSTELLYKSVYHFLLYICVAEILVVFLFIKLLIQKAF